MNRLTFIEHVEASQQAELELLRLKGEAYSGQDDCFDNFKRNAEKLGLTKYQIWAVYCGKHLDSIFNAIKSNPTHPIDKSEGLQGRVNDAINYLRLFSGMLAEDDFGKGTSIPTCGSDRRERTVDSATRRTNRKAP